MEKSVDLEEYKPYLWNNWYLTLKNRALNLILPVKIGDTEYDCFTKNKDYWDILITTDSITGKTYTTSSITNYCPRTKRVWTEGGGIYKLGIPLNGIQKFYLEKYFEL